jgi:hypothetical protein
MRSTLHGEASKASNFDGGIENIPTPSESQLITRE